MALRDRHSRHCPCHPGVVLHSSGQLEPPGRAAGKAADFRGGLRSSGKGSPTPSLPLPWAVAALHAPARESPRSTPHLALQERPLGPAGVRSLGVVPARSRAGGGVEGAPHAGGPAGGRGYGCGQPPPLERELISSGPGPRARAHSGSRSRGGLSRAPGTSQGQLSPREQGPEVASSGWAPCLVPADMLPGTEALAGQAGCPARLEAS